MDLFSLSPLDSLPNNASQAGLPEGRPICLVGARFDLSPLRTVRVDRIR
jgi:hypothetical protein